MATHLQPGATARLTTDSVTTLTPETREAVGILYKGTIVDVVRADSQDADRTIVRHTGLEVSVLSADLGPV